jgi:MSHA biogenesis protein MshO
MANDIQGEFDVAQATLQRNGLAKVTFMLNFDGQEVPIEQTLHVNNVP